MYFCQNFNLMTSKIKSLLAIALISIFSQINAQSFEGSITYALDFELSEKMTSAGLTKAAMLEKLKSEHLWWDSITTSYKAGNMYSSLGNSGAWSVYRADSNKIFTFQNIDSMDICEVNDASIDLEFTMTGKMPRIIPKDTIVMVNNIACQMIRVKWKTGTYDYYFNKEQFKIDPALFSKHVYDGWAEFTKLSGCLPIKIVKTTKGIMSVSMTMVSSKAGKVDDKLFTIPELTTNAELNMVPMPNKQFYTFKR